MEPTAKGQKASKTAPTSAMELFPGGVPSKQWQDGRRLKLFFDCGDRPELDRIEFYASNQQGTKFGLLQRGFGLRESSIRWDKMPKALSLFFLDFLNAGRAGKPFAFRRTKQTDTLGDAISKSNGKLYKLFVEYPPTGQPFHRVDKVFGGSNLHGRNDRERLILVKTDYLPHDCVEIYWEKKLIPANKLAKFTELFRKVWKLPPPCEPDFSILEEIDQPEPEPAKASEQAPDKQPKQGEFLAEPPKAEPKPPAGQGPSPQGQPQQDAPKPTPKEASPKNDATADKGASKDASEPETQPAQQQDEEAVQVPPIDPNLFKVKETGLLWPDDMPLIAWDQGDESYVWTLKNAFEGVLVMGATGSGKSSGSGATIAETFLRSGFGGLVMTVKTDEAERWRRLCAHCGREDDLVVVQRGGEWKLNVLAYEAQRPGQGAGLAENLTTFCRNLLKISTRSQGTQSGDPVWERAGDQLLNATFDLFLLAGSGLTFDRLADFVAAAPTKDLPESEAAWLKIPVFGSALAKAKKSIVSPEDKRIFSRATNYWFKVYPGYASKTRSSVTLGIFAMFDAFRGRDMPALLSSDTNITPESIMSGKIVVIDLPLKDLQHTGLMVQSSWKYLFQTALERHTRTGDPRRRPVFLWEDEGQYFFSDHDHHFQATARSARVSRVVLTQNLHNFYKEFGHGGIEAANSVFGNLNTKIFHANSDPATNEWAAKHFGQEIHHRLSISHNPPPPTPSSQDLSDAFLSAWGPPSTTGVSTTEHWEYAVRPEEFNCLRIGGPENDFQVDAYITWIGGSGTRQRHFTHITFNQNPNL